MPDAEAGVTPSRSASAVVLTGPPSSRLEREDRLRVVLDGRVRTLSRVLAQQRLWHA